MRREGASSFAVIGSPPTGTPVPGLSLDAFSTLEASFACAGSVSGVPSVTVTPGGPITCATPNYTATVAAAGGGSQGWWAWVTPTP